MRRGLGFSQEFRACDGAGHILPFTPARPRRTIPAAAMAQATGRASLGRGLQGYSPSLVLVVSLGDLCVVKLEGSRRPHDIRPAHAHKL